MKYKLTEFLDVKMNLLKYIELDVTGSFQVENKKGVEASYKLALLIVNNKKPHTIGESPVKYVFLLIVIRKL